jgi:hypothetical protein
MFPLNDVGWVLLVPSSTDLKLAADPRELAEERLLQSGYSVLRRIRCEFQDETLRLSGCLPSFYLKQVAQDAVARVAGVRAILNEIEVVRPAGPGEAAERYGGSSSTETAPRG